jgi:hypothetical protein
MTYTSSIASMIASSKFPVEREGEDLVSIPNLIISGAAKYY